MVESPPPVAARSLGYRIRAAREAVPMTQEALSRAMDIADRQTVSAIEKGDRAVKPDELVRLCTVLGRDINYFIDPFGVAGEAKFSWRATDALPDEQLRKFEEQAGAWVGLLRFLRQWAEQEEKPFGMSLRLGEQSSFEEALALGEAVAAKLKLGPVPALGLVEKVEKELDIPVLFVDAIDSPRGKVSGATCHLPDLGVILINRNEPLVRRNYDIAHELFHALTWDKMQPSHREGVGQAKSGKQWRIEKLADSFGAGLLMPSSSLTNFIGDRTADIAHLRDVADLLQVSPQALAYRLLNARIIDQELCNRLSRCKNRLPNQGVPNRFSPSFVDLVYRGIDRGHLSARKAAKAIGLTLPGLVELFKEHSKEPAPFAL